MVVIEIGDRLIKIAESGIVKGQKVIANLAAIELASKDDEGIAEETRQALQSMNIVSGHVQLNIPRHLVTVRFIRLPSVDDEEIEKMVRIESTKYVPYSEENVIYGYKIIEKYDDGYSKVLLAIAQAATIQRSIDILKKCGLGGITNLALSSESLVLWYLSATSAEARQGSVLLVNLDSDHIDVDVVKDDKLVFTRGILYDNKDQKSRSRMVGEIKLSMTTYQKESDARIDRVILSGAENDVSECLDMLKKELGVPVEMIDQMASIPINENARIDAQNASFAELLGLLFGQEKAKIDLMPEDIKEETRLESSKTNFILTLTLIGLILLAVFTLVVKKLHDRSVYLSYVAKEAKSLAPKVARSKKMIKDIDVIKMTMSRKPLAIDVIGEIYKITPPGISISMLESEGGRALTVRGTAPALDKVFKYVTTLEGSQYFEAVKVKYANKRLGAAKSEAADFEINCMLSKVK